MTRNDAERRIGLFLSDGYDNRRSGLTGILPCGGDESTIYSFAVGTGSSCGSPESVASLQRLADLGGGTCTRVVDPAQLAEVLSGSVSDEVVGLSVSVNGGPSDDISLSATPALPVADGFTFSAEVGDLPAVAEICVTATVEVPTGDPVEVAECVTVPSGIDIDAGPDAVGVEGDVVALAATASAGAAVSWSQVSGPPVLLAGSATAAPVVDDGLYVFRATASLGELSASDEVTVTVSNADPVIGVDSATTSDGIVVVTTTVTDLGVLLLGP